jgi:hypothetical protein
MVGVIHEFKFFHVSTLILPHTQRTIMPPGNEMHSQNNLRDAFQARHVHEGSRIQQCKKQTEY